MWITYNVNASQSVVPSALVACTGEGFPWVKTCDYNIQWYIAPNVLLSNVFNCNQPPAFSYVSGCN